MATTFEKVWQFDLNRLAADNTTVIQLSRSFYFWMKAFLTGQIGGATQGLYSIYGSCDGVTAGLDGVDRAGLVFDGTKIVRAAAGVAHSWMVLKSPLLATPAGNMNFYAILDFSGASDSAPLNLVFCKTAPTGGTTTARPVSVDEWAHAVSLTLNDNTNGTMRFHGWMPTDGSMFVVAAGKQGSGHLPLTIMGALLADTAATDQYPFATFANYNAAAGADGFAGSSASTQFLGTGPWRMRLADGSAVAANTSAVGLSIAGTSVGGWTFSATGGDYITATATDRPIEIGNSDANKAQIRGRLQDIVYHVGSFPTGTVEPLVGTPASIVIGTVCLPTNTALTL